MKFYDSVLMITHQCRQKVRRNINVFMKLMRSLHDDLVPRRRQPIHCFNTWLLEREHKLTFEMLRLFYADTVASDAPAINFNRKQACLK